ncbi:MAG: hypothetical protein ACI9UA_006335 [Pseudoalteromonas tetraodonis]|jgi:hypothetical protein
MNFLPFRTTVAALLCTVAISFNAAGQGARESTAPPAPTQKSLRQIWDKIAGLETKVNILETAHADLTVTVNAIDNRSADCSAGTGRRCDRGVRPPAPLAERMGGYQFVHYEYLAGVRTGRAAGDLAFADDPEPWHA